MAGASMTRSDSLEIPGTRPAPVRVVAVIGMRPESDKNTFRGRYEMSKMFRLRRLAALLAVVAIVAAACGSGDDEPAAAPLAPDVAADEPAVLPPHPNPDATPDPAGACLEGEPECNDTPDPGSEPLDLPLPGDLPDEPVSPSPMLVDGGLTVADALTTDATGVVAVKGFLLIDDSGARLCEVLAESYPPQCGGATLSITNYEEVLGVPLSNAQGVSWTDQHVSFLGEIIDGTLVVDPTVAQ